MGLRNHLVQLCHFTNEEPEVWRDSLVCPWSYRVSGSAETRLRTFCLPGQLWILKSHPKNRIFLKCLIQFIIHKIATFLKARLSQMSPYHCQAAWKICKIIQMRGKPERPQWINICGTNWKQHRELAFVNILNHFVIIQLILGEYTYKHSWFKFSW